MSNLPAVPKTSGLARLWEAPKVATFTPFPYLSMLTPKTPRKKAQDIANALGSLEDGELFVADTTDGQSSFTAVEGAPCFLLDYSRFFAYEEEQANGQPKKIVSTTPERAAKEQREYGIVATLFLLKDRLVPAVTKLPGAQARFAWQLQKEQAKAASPFGVMKLKESNPEACDPGFPSKLRVVGVLQGDTSKNYYTINCSEIRGISKDQFKLLLSFGPEALEKAATAALSVLEERVAYYSSLKPKNEKPAEQPVAEAPVEEETEDEAPF